MGQLQNHGILVILNFKGRKGLLAIKSILLKVKLKGPSEGALGGLKISIHRWFMDGGNILGLWWVFGLGAYYLCFFFFPS